MNYARFYVDIYDDVLKCEYFERTDLFQNEEIILPTEELRRLLNGFLKKYHEPVVDELSNDVTVLTFLDVDVLEMDKLIDRSKKYMEILNKNNIIKAETQVVKDNAFKQKRASRTNKFKKIFIKTTAGVLAVVTLYTVGKRILKEVSFDGIVTPDEITYTEPSILNFKNHDNVFSVDELIKEKDTTTLEENVYDDIEETQNDMNIDVIATNVENRLDDVVIDSVDTTDDNQVSLDNSDVPLENLTISESSNEDFAADISFTIEAEDWTDTEKYQIAHAYYYDTLEMTAKSYGIDPQLVLAICVHERGLHSEQVDLGGGLGLFQIQIEGGWNWDNKEITAFNFDTNSYETRTITKESASDVFENIRLGCMMIQNCLVRNNYNVLKSVTEYNYGSNYLDTVINVCSNQTGYSVSELNDMNNLEWLKYRNVIDGGDPMYLENVFKYIPSGSILTFQKPNGEVITMQYNNSNVMSKSV